eukprot:CAMPEP_0170393132 /NCGR_PEP_ID=MMETSP0117_2-20130122/20560_1 /TAXON_ID=400756 /ORGANISM="Durinskia baltica, Strain CSIRO CS-38" /LENGTH=33 /DNA_ID= /DNA_START= /DNA_END= /DNA_ORIENTATION=
MAPEGRQMLCLKDDVGLPCSPDTRLSSATSWRG